MNRPLIHVILIARQNEFALHRSLNALACQMAAPVYETTVIGALPDAKVRPLTDEFGATLNLTYMPHEHPDLSCAMTHAASVESTPILLLMSDDWVADAYFLCEHFRAHARHPEPRAVIMGHTILAGEIARDPLLQYLSTHSRPPFLADQTTDDQMLDPQCIASGMFSCKRSLLAPWKESPPTAPDSSMGRLIQHGITVYCASHALAAWTRTMDCDTWLQEWHPGHHRTAATQKVQKLDAIARDMLNAGLELDPLDGTLLEQAYNDAL